MLHGFTPFLYTHRLPFCLLTTWPRPQRQCRRLWLSLSLPLSRLLLLSLSVGLSFFSALSRRVFSMCLCYAVDVCLFSIPLHMSRQFSVLSSCCSTHTHKDTHTHRYTHSQTEGNKRRFVVCAARFHFILFLIQFLLRLMCWVWRIWRKMFIEQ